MVIKGTTQESVSGPHLFNLFMVKYADDSTILVTVNEDLDNSERALSHFMDWTNNNNMKCNTDKCKELVVRNRSHNSIYSVIYNIKQYDHVTLLGVKTIIWHITRMRVKS